MKKTLLTIILLITSFQAGIAQTYYFDNDGFGDVNLTLYTNTDFLIGTSTRMSLTKKIGIGIHASYSTGGAIGVDYSEVMGPNAFPEDIYEVKTGMDQVIHFSVDRNFFDKFTLGGLIGWADYSTKHNAYDKHQIMSVNGNYYTENNHSSKLSIGITSTQTFYTENKIAFITQLAYTTTEKLVVGAGVKYKW